MYKVIKIIFILFFLSIPVISSAETKLIKIVFLGNLADEDYDGSLVFKNYVESHSYGKLKVEIYPGAQLCGCAIECLMALKSGIIEIYMGTAADVSAIYPPVQVLDLPYMLDSNRIAEEVFNGPFLNILQKKMLEYTKVIRLMRISNTGGWRCFATTKRMIKEPNNLKGVKIRTLNSEIQIKMMKLLSANPTPVAWPELYSALSTGVVEGSSNSITDIVGMKLHEKIKYIILDEHSYMASLWMINNKFFKNLSEDLQKIIIDGFYELSDVSIALPKRRAVDAYAEFIKKGGEIYLPNNREKALFREKVYKPLIDWYTKKYGDELFKVYDEAIKNAKSKIDNEYNIHKSLNHID